MSSSRPVFRSRWLPYLLVAPQLIITVIFLSGLRAKRCGTRYKASIRLVSPASLSAWITSSRCSMTATISTPSDDDKIQHLCHRQRFAGIAVLCGAGGYIVRGSRFYQTLMLLPYAVAPAVAAVLWIFLFNPGRGLITHFLAEFGYDWNHAQNSGQAMFLVVFASVWKQISYNFLFFYAALQSIPRSLIEAAAIDGAGPIRRFFKIALPLIAPVSFFLLVVNLVYAFFDTFPVIDAATSGGPVQATTTLIYKIYREGFTGLDLASSAAQSVVLMFLVIVLTVVQFRYVESKVRYQ